MQAKKKETRESKARQKIIQSALTWGHSITMSVLAIAAICNIGGLIAIILKSDLAGPITSFVERWQGFYIAGILGYDAKTTVENALKITKSISELRSAASSSTDAVENG